MYLKSLTLKGFKSFADRTSMVFDPGLSVVVGPNGSGKSNVSDAILWVLGEQSAKQLRGQAMEDVIFSGSSARNAVGLAEVTLVLDNSDRTLPVDFDEVGVTRRMYRSGESEYLINGAPARLMDVQDILHDSGLGKDTHSIISQGKLDAVLSSKPEERRSLIEEAAGISKHRRRKERSQRKLKAMEENVRRAKDLNREIQRQLRPLERQVDKAQRFNDLDARRAHLETVLAVDDLRRLQGSWNAVSSQRTEAEAAVELAQYRSDEKAANLERLQSMLEQKGLFVGDLGEQRRRVQDQLGRVESDMRLLEEKGRNMVAKLSDTRMSLSTLERQRREAQAEHDKAAGELEEVRAKQADLRATLSELGPAADDAARAHRAVEERAALVAAELRQAQRESDAAVLEHARLQERVANAEVEDAMFASRLAQIQETLDTDSQALVASRARQADADHGVADARKALDKSARAIEEGSRAVKAAHRAEDAARSALADARASLKALESVDATNADASPLAAVVAKDASVRPLLKGRVADRLRAPEELEPLVERLLGPSLEALLVDDDAAALALARRAAQVKKSKGALVALPLDLVAAPAPAGEAPGARLADLLDPAPADAVLVEALLGAVRVVESAQEALAGHRAAPGWVFAAKDGALVDREGRLSVGAPAAESQGVLERKRRIRALQEGMPSLEEGLSDAHAKVQEAQKAVNGARDEQNRARAEVSRLNAEADAARREAGRLESSVARGEAERASIEKRRAEAGKKAEEARPKLASLKRQAEEADARAAKLSAEQEEVAALRHESLARENEAKQAASEAKLSLATVTERRRHLETSAEQLARSVEGLSARIETAVLSTRSLEVLRLRIDPLHERYEALRERVRAWAERLRDRASLAEADSESLKKTIGGAKAEAAAAAKELEEANARLAEVKVAAGRLEVQVENAVNAVRACDAMPLEEALSLPEPEDRPALEKELDKVRRDIQGLGPVNQVAWDQYNQLKERADYIGAQLADLEHAKGALDKIQAAIDRKMRRAFLSTFDAVNANFKEIFSMLFPGGRAHLEMDDPDHPATTGIEIVAQPRGKKIPKLALMSGGEKSLCALAVLFAVYRTRTVPFYVFDEVEAALDDSNLDKLLGAIERLKDETQLIVISHQRRTMEQADVLWGVSMQADGVSHVVSQRLDRATGKVVDA